MHAIALEWREHPRGVPFGQRHPHRFACSWRVRAGSLLAAATALHPAIICLFIYLFYCCKQSDKAVEGSAVGGGAALERNALGASRRHVQQQRHPVTPRLQRRPCSPRRLPEQQAVIELDSCDQGLSCASTTRKAI